MKDVVCHKATGVLLCKIDKEELITLCIKYNVCMYCGGNLKINARLKNSTSMICKNCEGEFIKYNSGKRK